MEWPRSGGLRYRTGRERARFESTFSATLDLLQYELGCIDAEAVVIKLDLEDRDIRRDGWPRSKATPGHPGVVVEWQVGERWSRMAADKFDHWHDNLRAIAKSLEALRGVERWGVVEGEQYEGLRLKLEAPGAMSESVAWRVLAEAADIEPSEAQVVSLRTLVALALKRSHPDRGGDLETFQRVMQAKAILEGES